MRISIEEIKKAVDWLRVNTNQQFVDVYTGEGNKMILSTIDKNDNQVEIVLFVDEQMLPKIKKTEVLR